MANGSNEDETYKKRTGAAGAEGHLMEINLLTLCKLRGDRQLKYFNLAGNLESAGDFDDVVFRYTDEKSTHNVIFLQSKFKQNANHQITIKTFDTDRDWPLQKYFKSFTRTQDEFKRRGCNDPIFGRKTDNCHFIIYTNAKRHDDLKEHVVDVENPLKFVLGETCGAQAFKLKLDKAVELLQGVQHQLEIEQVLKYLTLISTAQCDRLQGDHNFKKYHAFFAHTVLVKDGRCWKFRDHFLEGKQCQNEILKRFREQTFSWYIEKKMGVKKSKDMSSADIIGHMKERCRLELPPWFGNAIPKFQKKLCDDFIKIATRCISDNICTVKKFSKKPMNDISKFVGNVLVFDEDKAMFKLNEARLDGGPREILQYLIRQLENHNIDPINLYMDIQVENFPKLCLGFTQIDSKRVGEFADKLFITTGQPDGDALKRIIERDFGNMNDREVGRHHHIIGKMTDWWKQLGMTKYLRKDDGFLEGILNGILFNLSDPIQSFTGRTRELAKLHKALRNNESGDRTAVISQMASVSGLGGVGKSELARQYAHTYGHCYDGNVIWVNAETRYSMQNCFLTLCKDYLNIQTQDANNKEIEMATIVQKVYSFFRDRESLFVFDNAQYYKCNRTPNDNINDFLPATKQSTTHILITSRNQEWQCTVMIELGVLEDAEAEQLVKHSLGIEDDRQDSDVKQLIKQLHNFPLALQQAVAYIRQKGQVYSKTRTTQFTISDYLKLFKDKTKQLLDFQFPDDCVDKYTKTTFMTWNITLAEIEKSELGAEARESFNIMAYLNPNDIPLKLFTESVNNDLEKLDEAFMLLEKYSMITLRNGMASIHRLVQSVTRLMLLDAGKQYHILKTALSNIRNHTDHQLIAQCASVWDYANEDDDLVTEFNTVPAQIIEALRETWRYEESTAFGKVAHETLGLKIGHGHTATLSAQYQLAQTLLQQGHYKDASIYFKEVLEKRTNILAADHPDLLDTQHFVANTMAELGRYEDAFKSYKEVLEKRTTILAADHPSTLSTEHEIAKILFEQGKYDEALSCYKDVLEKRTNILAADHPSTLNTQHGIANTLYEQGKYEDALMTYTDVLRKRNQIFKPNHPSILNTQHEIANVLFRQGKYADALSSYEEVLQKRTKILAPDHPDNLTTQHCIAKTQSQLGQYDEALSSFKEVLKKKTILYGPDHPYTLATQHYTAKTLCQQGQYEQALNSFKEVLMKKAKIVNPDHPSILTTLQEIAIVLFEQGKYEEALSFYKEVLGKKIKTLTADHPSILNTQHEIANILFEQGKYYDALSSYKEVLEKRTKILGPDHPSTLTTQHEIANVLFEQGQYEDALNLYKWVLQKRTQVLKPDHPFIFTTQHEIANTLSQLGKHEEALSTYKEVLEKRTKILRPDHPFTLNTKQGIANTLSQLGQYDEALSCYEEVLEKRTKIFGPDHPSTLATRQKVSCTQFIQEKSKTQCSHLEEMKK